MFVEITSFVKPASLNGCLTACQEVFNGQGLTNSVFFDGGNGMVIGGNANVTVTIISVPQAGGTWMAVSASAEDPALAGQTRDVLSQMIQNTPAF